MHGMAIHIDHLSWGRRNHAILGREIAGHARPRATPAADGEVLDRRRAAADRQLQPDLLIRVAVPCDC